MANTPPPTGSSPWPAFMDGLMNSAPGSIARRFPRYWSDGEGGIDWTPPAGTPVIALADGVVKGAGYFCVAQGIFNGTNDMCDHGVITTRVTNQDGSQTDLYYQHIRLASNVQLCFNSGECTQTVKKGDVLGYIEPNFNIEMGVNVGNVKGNPPYPNGWGTIWGTDPAPGPHVDPEAYLRALASGQNTTGTLSGAGLGTGTGNLNVTPGSIFPSQLLGWLSSPMRIVKMLVGVLLIGLSLWMLVVPEAAGKVGTFIQQNPEVLAA